MEKLDKHIRTLYFFENPHKYLINIPGHNNGLDLYGLQIKVDFDNFLKDMFLRIFWCSFVWNRYYYKLFDTFVFRYPQINHQLYN